MPATIRRTLVMALATAGVAGALASALRSSEELPPSAHANERAVAPTAHDLTVRSPAPLSPAAAAGAPRAPGLPRTIAPATAEGSSAGERDPSRAVAPSREHSALARTDLAGVQAFAAGDLPDAADEAFARVRVERSDAERAYLFGHAEGGDVARVITR